MGADSSRSGSAIRSLEKRWRQLVVKKLEAFTALDQKRPWHPPSLPAVDDLVTAVGLVLAFGTLTTLALYGVWSFASM